MSGIYISNMDMPYYVHQEIDFIPGTNGKWYAIADGSWREVIPIPDHGKLIDVDALLASANQHYAYLEDEWYVKVSTIENAPIIIPAEKGECIDAENGGC